jgi:hypothetical protein
MNSITLVCYERIACVYLCSVLVICFGNPASAAFVTKKVHEVAVTLPEFPKIDVSAPDRFLNDLMLSPLWKVEKERDGSFSAKARSVAPGSPFDETGGQFLLELMATPDRPLPKDYRIRDAYLEGQNTFTSFQIHVVFRKPDLARATLAQSRQKTTLAVYESYESKIGPNSFSDLAVKLSSKHEVYVVLHEQGADQARTTTFAKLLPALRELAAMAANTNSYRVEERYAAFFRLFFDPTLQDQEIRRFPGSQDRDTFYGYFRVKPGTSYNGINIKISHPVYCPDEGTRKHSRLQKAEYSGVPYHEKDIVFFLIEDNAVYLSDHRYNQRFGTFTGRESFDGTLDVLNEQGIVLLKTTDKFKGWQQ